MQGGITAPSYKFKDERSFYKLGFGVSPTSGSFFSDCFSLSLAYHAQLVAELYLSTRAKLMDIFDRRISRYSNHTGHGKLSSNPGSGYQCHHCPKNTLKFKSAVRQDSVVDEISGESN